MTSRCPIVLIASRSSYRALLMYSIYVFTGCAPHAPREESVRRGGRRRSVKTKDGGEPHPRAAGTSQHLPRGPAPKHSPAESDRVASLVTRRKKPLDFEVSHETIEDPPSPSTWLGPWNWLRLHCRRCIPPSSRRLASRLSCSPRYVFTWPLQLVQPTPTSQSRMETNLGVLSRSFRRPRERSYCLGNSCCGIPAQKACRSFAVEEDRLPGGE